MDSLLWAVLHETLTRSQGSQNTSLRVSKGVLSLASKVLRLFEQDLGALICGHQ